jgi:DHA2 family multidrug resistance protein
VTFSTLPSDLRNEGTALYSLIRNIGMSIGVSIVITLLARFTQAGHAGLVTFVNPFWLPLQAAADAGVLDPTTPSGLALIDAEVTRQAALLAYLQDFRLMMWVTIAALPLVLLLRSDGRKAAAAGTAGARAAEAPALPE